MDTMTFRLDEKQTKAYKEWVRNHNCPNWNKEFDGRYVGCAGGADKFYFCPTTIGMIAKVKCCCGSELDLSEWW